MDVVVVGAEGQLGREVVRGWTADRVTGLARADLDITDRGAVHAAIGELRPDVVVNCAAWTDVDGCESDPARAHSVNADGPRWLAEGCEATGATLVHVSTDYVFGGDAPTDAEGAPRGWHEDDPIAPPSVYGRSKAAGEQAVRESCERHHIARTAWVCGAHGRNFVTTMLGLAERGTTVRVVDDQVGNPTFTADLAPALRELATSGTSGTWHRTNSERASWFDLAAATFALAGLEVDLQPQPSSALDRPAPRPAWSVLGTPATSAAGFGELPSWRDGLARLLTELGARA